jgi:hypothetical protein
LVIAAHRSNAVGGAGRSNAMNQKVEDERDFDKSNTSPKSATAWLTSFSSLSSTHSASFIGLISTAW